MTVRHLLSGAVLAAAATLFAASGASAQNFNFSSSTTPSSVTSDLDANTFVTFGTGSDTNVSAPSVVVLSSLNTFSNNATTQNFTNKAFTTTITLTGNGPSVGSVTQTLNGFLSGQASTTVGSFFGTFSQSQLDFVFSNGTVSLFNFQLASPSTPGATVPGSVRANTRFTPNAVAPEPGSLALVATGMMGAMGMVVRRRRSAK